MTDPLLNEDIKQRDYTALNNDKKAGPTPTPDDSTVIEIDQDNPQTESDAEEMIYEGDQPIEIDTEIQTDRFKTTAKAITEILNFVIRKLLSFGWAQNVGNVGEKLKQLPEDLKNKVVGFIKNQESKLIDIISLDDSEKDKFTVALIPVLAKYNVKVIPNRFEPEFNLLSVGQEIASAKVDAFNMFLVEMNSGLENMTKMYLATQKFTLFKIAKLFIKEKFSRKK